MQYESVILELLERIKQLENSHEQMETRLARLEDAIEERQAAVEGEIDGAEEPEQRKKMTPEMMAACYECASRLHQTPEVNFGRALDGVVGQTGMNRNSAIMYVYAVKSMLAGEGYKRAISQPATELFFNLILRDYGPEGLHKALAAARSHIVYRKQYGHVVDGLEKLCDVYEEKQKRAAAPINGQQIS